MSRKRILVVEDQVIVAMDIQAGLERLGYSAPFTVTSGEEALELVAREKPDLVLMDIHLSGELDGIATAGVIRETHKIPVVYLTAYSDEEILQRVYGTEPFGYVLKPYEDRALRTAIEIALYRYEMDRRIRKSEQWLSAVLGSIADGVLVTDLSGKVEFFNQAATDLLDLESSVTSFAPDLMAVTSVNSTQLHHPAIQWDHLIRTLIENRIPVHCFGLTPNHTRKPYTPTLDISISVVYLDEEGGISLVWVVRDVSEKKKVETKLIRSQRMEGLAALTAGISHDINNVLSPVLMAVGYFKQDSETMPQGMVDMIETAIRRCADLVKQIQSISRGMEDDTMLVQPRYLLKEIEKLIRASFPRNIRISSNIASNLGSVVGDVSQLHQALLSIFIRCSDGMPCGGEIQISAKNVQAGSFLLDSEFVDPQRQFIQIDISDTGAPHEVNLNDAGNDDVAEYGGSGEFKRYDAIMKLVQKNQGYLFHQEFPGEPGNHYKIFLPVAQPVRVPSTEHSSTDRLPVGDREWILVVDDEQGIREIARNLLETFNYRVLTAGNGLEALSLLREKGNQISAVILDLAMPMMDGLSCLRSIRSFLAHTPVIVVSGVMSPPEELTSHTADPLTVFLAKPLTGENLLCTLSRVIHAERG